jgi:hypothetical protein
LGSYLGHDPLRHSWYHAPAADTAAALPVDLDS